jgi:hypothetical protein
VAKWKKRTSVADLPTGPKNAKSTVLTLDEEAVAVALRRRRQALLCGVRGSSRWLAPTSVVVKRIK